MIIAASNFIIDIDANTGDHHADDKNLVMEILAIKTKRSNLHYFNQSLTAKVNYFVSSYF